MSTNSPPSLDNELLCSSRRPPARAVNGRTATSSSTAVSPKNLEVLP